MNRLRGLKRKRLLNCRGDLDQSKTLVGKPDLLQALELDDIVAAMHPEEKFGTGILASVPVASDSYAPASLFVSVTREASLDLKRVLVLKKSRSFRCSQIWSRRWLLNGLGMPRKGE